MAQRQSLTVTLANPSTTGDRPTLVLEQEPYEAGLGKVSKVALINYLGQTFFGEAGSDEEDDTTWRPDVRCGLDGLSCGVVVYAYPSTQLLRFQVGASYGELGVAEKQEPELVETISLSMEDEATTDHPAFEILAAVPRGDLYDKNGAIVAVPAIVIDGDKIKLSQKVFGSIAVLYRTLRYRYTLDIEARPIDTTLENYFSSVVYAWWAGDGTWLEIDPPPNADELAAGQHTCGWGGKNDIEPDPERKRKPLAAGADRNINISYCSGEVLTDTTSPWVDWGEE